jgi:adenylyl cyclase-associated protein
MASFIGVTASPPISGPSPRHSDIQNPLLTALVSRLEAATSRLEDIATSTHGLDPTSRSVGPTPSSISSSIPPSAGPTATIPAAKTGAAAPIEEDLPAVVVEFDTIVKDDLAPLEKISQGLGGLVAEQVRLAAWACVIPCD